jgi:hypothetical protein
MLHSIVTRKWPRSCPRHACSAVVVDGRGDAAPAATPKPAAAALAPAQAAVGASRGPSAPAAAAAQQPPVKGMVCVNLSTKVYHKEGDRY